MKRNFIKFNLEDRNYSSTSMVWKPEKGYEEIITIHLPRYYRWEERKRLLDLFNSHGIVSDLNEWDGSIVILLERCEGNKELPIDLVAHARERTPEEDEWDEGDMEE